jgi:hypothetical protein
MTIDLHVMIRHEDDGYAAICLEMGLATSGPDLDVVERDMMQLIYDHITACLDEGRSEDMFVPAPPEYWSEYAEAIASDSCHERTELNMPRIAAPNEAKEVSRYTRKVAAHSFVCA